MAEIRNCKHHHLKFFQKNHVVRVREVKVFNGFLVFVVMVDPANLSLAFRKIQGKNFSSFRFFNRRLHVFHHLFLEGQFDSVFLPFIHQRPKFQANCQLWTAYKPNVSSSTGNTLPRLCKKCTKNGKSHVGLDPFPQKSSTAIVWYRINVQDFQGEVIFNFCRINFV